MSTSSLVFILNACIKYIYIILRDREGDKRERRKMGVGLAEIYVVEWKLWEG